MGRSNYKRVPFDGEALYDAIRRSKISLKDLAKKVSVSVGYFTYCKNSGKINPAVLVKINSYVDFDIDAICPDLRFELVTNGRGTKSGRMRVDWDYVDKIIRTEGYTYGRLSEMLGHSDGYLSGCRVTGGMSADMIKKLAEILGVEPETITDYIEPGAANIIYLVNSQKYR